MGKTEKSAIDGQGFGKRFVAKHTELWKFVKFAVAGGLSTLIELVIYYILQWVVFRSLNTAPIHFWIFNYEGLGYMWSFLISTTIGYAIAFVLNRKVTFHSDANPALSIFLYVVMVLFTICVTTWMGAAILDFCIAHNIRGVGEVLAKPFVATIATVWTYPINRFIIHRKKKDIPTV